MRKVDLNIVSRSAHCMQIITGFHMLEQQGLIELDIHDVSGDSKKYPSNNMVEICVDNKVIAFDVSDGYPYGNRVMVMENYLDEGCDYYFKRSFSEGKNRKYVSAENLHKIKPLGFNYYVTYQDNSWDSSINSRSFRKRLNRMFSSHKGYVYEYESSPNFDENKKEQPNIIFCTRLWNPAETEDCKEAQTRFEINKMRMEIVEHIQKQYGSNFVGGIRIDDYSKKVCPSNLLLAKSISHQANYIKLMKQADICVGSMGLHESIGWKTGEYIAASRAIINEKFHYQVPGDFEIGRNYLSYETTEECLAAIQYLIDKPHKIREMQEYNNKYYIKYLRPDKLVWNALNSALGGF